MTKKLPPPLDWPAWRVEGIKVEGALQSDASHLALSQQNRLPDSGRRPLAIWNMWMCGQKGKHFFQCCTRRAADCAISIFQPFYNLLRCEHEWSSKLAQKVKLVVQACNTREIPKSLDHGRLSWNFSAKWFRWNIRTLWWPKILLFRKKGFRWGPARGRGGGNSHKGSTAATGQQAGLPPLSLPARSWATSAAHAQWETGQGACAGEGQAGVAQAQ